MNGGAIPVLVALIAAISALIVSAWQSYAQRKTAQATEELRAGLEQQRVQFQVALDNQRTSYTEYLKAYIALQIQGRDQRSKAFEHILRETQMFRDVLKELNLRTVGRSKPVEEIASRKERVVSAFAEHGPHLSGTDRKYAHDMKNLCIDIATICDELFEANPRESEERALERIRADSHRLDECQEAFREGAARARNEFLNLLEREASNRSEIRHVE